MLACKLVTPVPPLLQNEASGTPNGSVCHGAKPRPLHGDVPQLKSFASRFLPLVSFNPVVFWPINVFKFPNANQQFDNLGRWPKPKGGVHQLFVSISLIGAKFGGNLGTPGMPKCPVQCKQNSSQ